MNQNKNDAQSQPLTQLPVPALDANQLNKFSIESIHSTELFSFDPGKAIELLNKSDGKHVLAADFGGDKGVTKLFIVKNGRIEISNEYEDYVQGNGGEGYLESMEKTAKFASENNIPVGISWGGPIAGTIPQYHPKANIFLEKLTEKYSGDINNIFPSLKACLNDGPAGAISALIEADRSHDIRSMIFSINGGGLGMAVFDQGIIYSVEAGHVEAVSDLNKYGQNVPCGVFGATYVCIERLGANKAGIEAQWALLKGETLHAKEIEDRYKEGDILAGELYDHSAYVLAHQVVGVAKVFGIDLASVHTCIAGHGGAYKFPFYGERVQQIIESFEGNKPALIMTKDIGSKDSNACLDGAAIAALLQN